MTTYLNSLNGKQGKYGIKISGKAEDVIAEIKKYANDKGYINLEIKERKEPGRYGHTHYVVLDTWEPKEVSKHEENLPF